MRIEDRADTDVRKVVINALTVNCDIHFTVLSSSNEYFTTCLYQKSMKIGGRVTLSSQVVRDNQLSKVVIYVAWQKNHLSVPLQYYLASPCLASCFCAVPREAGQAAMLQVTLLNVW